MSVVPTKIVRRVRSATELAAVLNVSKMRTVRIPTYLPVLITNVCNVLQVLHRDVFLPIARPVSKEPNNAKVACGELVKAGLFVKTMKNVKTTSVSRIVPMTNAKKAPGIVQPKLT